MYRLRLKSIHFGVDDGGPLHPSKEVAIAMAQHLLSFHKAPIRAEILQITLQGERRVPRVVEILDKAHDASR